MGEEVMEILMTEEERLQWLKAIEHQLKWYRSEDMPDEYPSCFDSDEYGFGAGICDTVVCCCDCLWVLFEGLGVDGYCTDHLEQYTSDRIARLPSLAQPPQSL